VTAVLHQPTALSHSIKLIKTSCKQSQALTQHEVNMLDCSCCTDDRYQSYTYLLFNQPSMGLFVIGLTF